MEDYSIGSLSELISGKKTPDKKKVVKKEFKTDLVAEKRANENNNDEDSPKKKKLKGVVIDHSQKVEQEDTDEEKPSINDINAERRIKKKEKDEKKVDDTPEQKERTVFVGNLPIATTKTELKKLFSKYGPIETLRFRGIPVANPKTPKKVALIKNDFHPERSTFYGYVRFKSADSAVKAVEANGILYNDHHLRVQRCVDQTKNDESKAIFVGNLNFKTEEEELWKAFECCGEISSVRIVRDGRNGMGKGFGYVNFKESDGVTLALEMEKVEIRDREVRISLCNLSAAKKNRKKNKGGNISKITKPGKPKTFKKNKEEKSNNEEGVKKAQAKPFQGSKFTEKKKKNKFNKGLAQKKKMIKKIAPQ